MAVAALCLYSLAEIQSRSVDGQERGWTGAWMECLCFAFLCESLLSLALRKPIPLRHCEESIATLPPAVGISGFSSRWKWYEGSRRRRQSSGAKHSPAKDSYPDVRPIR